MEMRKRNCFSLAADTTYALLFYLLYASDEMIRATTYYVGKNLSSLPLHPKIVLPPIEPYTNKELRKYRWRCLKFRKSLKHSEIFAQDHLYFSAPLIDNLPYTVLEDCPNFFTVLNSHPDEPSYKDSLRARLYNFLVGRIYNRYGGYNSYCINRIVTSDSDLQLFNHLQLNCEQCNLQDMWDNASDFKRTYIKQVFSVDSMMEQSMRPVVIFSQPLTVDCHFSASEVSALFQPYIEKYGAERILVKLHPRDIFDYNKYFPGISVMSTKAPQQLLSIMGYKFKTAITVCSSAVSNMDDDTEIIWIGAEVDERIVKAYGHVKCPPKVHKS